MNNANRQWVRHRVVRVAIAVAVTASTTVLGASAVTTPPVHALDSDGITSINPARFLDTRAGESTIDGRFQATGRLTGGRELVVEIGGRSGVPADATAAMMNITAVRPDGPGHITVYPCGTTPPLVSNINYRGDDVAPNAVLSKLGSGGRVCVVSLRATDLIIDVNAYVPAQGTPTPVQPARLVDTRRGERTIDGRHQATGRLSAGVESRFAIAGRAGVPGDATAAMMNITAVRPDGPGHITVYPCGTPRPLVSNINYAGGDVAPNAVLSKLGTGGQICVVSLQATDLIIDVNAFVPVGGAPTPVEPARFADTRSGQRTIDGRYQGTGRLAAGVEQRFRIGGRADITVDATAVMMNITAVRPDGPGHITVYPCGATVPTTSNINYRGNDVAPNAVLSKLDSEGQVCVFSLRATDLIIDVNAYVPVPVTGQCVIGGTPIPTEVPTQECDALVDLYNSTSGSSWVRRDGWATPTDPCTWHGIECTNGQVTDINLSGNALNGSLPASIGNLWNLQKLDLSTNLLNGPIPSSIGNLANLFYLDLRLNSLTGTIPSAIGQARQLSYLDLSLNSGFDGVVGLTGPIPATITDLRNLTYLSLSANDLTGPIPSFFGQMTNLAELKLGMNDFSGSLPDSLGNLPNLAVLQVFDNQLTGPIPSSIGNMAALRVLDLARNDFSGTIPSTLVNATRLTELRIEDNQLSGSLPANIGDLTELKRLHASDNQLIGSIPDSLASLNQLIAIDLANNQLAGEVPSAMVTLTWLFELRLAGNNCLTAANVEIETWLAEFDADWDDGC